MSRKDRWKEKQRQIVKEKMDKSVRAAQIYDALTKQNEERISRHYHSSHSSHGSSSSKESTKRKIVELSKSFIYYPLVYAGIIAGLVIIGILLFAVLNRSLIKESVSFKKPVFEEYVKPQILQIHSDVSDGAISKNSISTPKANENYAVIQCDKLGENSINVFYLGNYDALKIGSAQQTEGRFIGCPGVVFCYAYHTTYFKNLSNIKVDDSINVSTPYGRYVYSVYKTAVSRKKAEIDEKDGSVLVLYTDEYSGVTGKKTAKNIYVYAKMVSGPTVTQ